jgi:hypothetical protein
VTARRFPTPNGLAGREIIAKDVEDDHLAYVERLRRSMRGAIGFARRRQAKKAEPVPVDISLDELMEILHRQDYRCAITGLRFWSGSAVAYGPAIPSLDRMSARRGYTRSNIRVVLLGVNGLRGAGSDDDMLMIARAVVENGPGRHSALQGAGYRLRALLAAGQRLPVGQSQRGRQIRR